MDTRIAEIMNKIFETHDLDPKDSTDEFFDQIEKTALEIYKICRS
jgi:uncharacterized protein YkuJ